MMTIITSASMVREIRKALLLLWLYEELGHLPSIKMGNRAEIINSVAELAADALQTAQETSDVTLESALFELEELQTHDIAYAEQVLYRVLSKLSPENSDLNDQDKVEFLESLVVSILREIQLKTAFEQARNELGVLNKVATIVARLAFEKGAKLSKRMDVFVRDFEHADEDVVLRSIYQDIKCGDYLSAWSYF